MSGRTEPPTATRLERARRDGALGASALLTAAISLLAGALFLAAAVRHVIPSIETLLGEAIAKSGADDPSAAIPSPEACGEAFIAAAAPLLVLGAFVGIVASLAQAGGNVSFARLAPRFSRLSLATGFARLFSMRSLSTLFRIVAAGTLISWLSFAAVTNHLRDIAALSEHPRALGALATVLSCHVVLLPAAALLLCFGGADLIVTRLLQRRELRMTRSEVRREQREIEGDPRFKGALRARRDERLRDAAESPPADEYER